MEKTIFDAVCKNKIASIRLILDMPLGHVSKVYRTGDSKGFLRGKYKADTIVYKGTSYTLTELCKLLGPIALYITSENQVRCAPQVIIHRQECPWSGKVECARFTTDESAQIYYEQLIKENSLEEIDYGQNI